MKVRRIVANLRAPDPALANAFYRDILGLDVLMDMDWIRTYGNDATMSVQLSFMREGGSGTAVPDLSVEVDDVDGALRRFDAAGIPIEYGPANEPWGVRRFFVRDPFGRLVNVLSHVETNARRSTHAVAKISVYEFEARPYDAGSSPTLMDIRLTETFTGDIDGASTVRALQVRHDDRTARMLSLQRFAGKLNGREGTFVLQGSEIVEGGRIKATWFIVPGSGTGDLAGLRGNGGFEGEFGKESDGTLDYWFE